MQSQFYRITVADPRNKNKSVFVKTLVNFKTLVRFRYLATLEPTKNEPCKVTIELCHASSNLTTRLETFVFDNRAQLIASLINAHEVEKRS